MDDPFLERMDSQLAGWTDPVQRLRSAIENNEFELYCQPILQFAGDERYPMAEVLVRLREEERALLPPGEFLPVFEHYKMMPQLDRWVVRHTVKRLAEGSRIPRSAARSCSTASAIAPSPSRRCASSARSSSRRMAASAARCFRAIRRG